MVEGVRDARTVETDLVEQPPVESQGEGAARRSGQGRVPGGAIRSTARGMGDREPTGVSTQDAADAVDATPTEKELTERPERPDQRPDEQPLPEAGDGVSDGDTVGQRRQSPASVSEGRDPGRRGRTDTREPDGTDAVVDSNSDRLNPSQASEGTYTPIPESHIEGTPLVMPSMLAALLIAPVGD